VLNSTEMKTSLLLADDSPTIAKILGMALQAEPIDIRAVQTAEAAMTELQLQPPYFFLVDLMLPEINGYEFTRLIRSDAKLEGVKVVLLSSAFDPIDEAEYRACGADAVIAKPFDPSELRELLHKLQGLPPPAPHVEEGEENDGFLENAPDPSSLLGAENTAPSSDADSILAGLLEPSDEAAPGVIPETLEAFDLSSLGLSALPDGAERPDPTVILDMSGGDIAFQPEEPVLDLSNSWQTPPGGTALIETAGQNLAPPPETPPPAPAPLSDLSPNAGALAAFFAAEIDANSPPAAPPPSPVAARPSAPPSKPPAPAAASPEDSFDASLSSIDWGGPAEANLSNWSSSTPPKAPERRERTSSLDAPPSAPPGARPSAPPPAAASLGGLGTAPAHAPPSAPPRAPSPAPVAAAAPPAAPAAPAPSANNFAGASSDRGSFLFDTGGSSFRFADDYVQRITKSFTGAVDEMVLGKDPTASPSASPVFGQVSNDGAPAGRAPVLGEEDLRKIEAVVRQEVSQVVREMVERVAWEVIPELAENLIRRQLDQVLKEIDDN
jgi:CheY-like chemotaxis protein